jgi:GTP cyclohydrolase I
MTKNTDKQQPSDADAEAAVRLLLDWIGEDSGRKGLLRTPAEILGSSFPDANGYQEIVALTDIDFESHCEHHIAPFIGRAHVAYMPDKKVVGVSKLVRVVNAYAKRLQIQEKLTSQIADCINDVLQPRGVAVVIEARHECMTTRGVYKNNIRMVTSSMLGCFQDDAQLRSEFLSLLRNSAK